jgi:hypothetical protein
LRKKNPHGDGHSARMLWRGPWRVRFLAGLGPRLTVEQLAAEAIRRRETPKRLRSRRPREFS